MKPALAALSLFVVLGACASEPRPPVAETVEAPLVVPPIPSASAGASERDAGPAPVCDERDPTPDAKPSTPAPAAFTKIDGEIHRAQARPEKYVYTGSVADVMGDGKGKPGAFQNDKDEAAELARRIEVDIVDANEKPEWSVVALVREAETFERLRDGLAQLTLYRGAGAPPPGQVVPLTLQQQTLLATMRSSGRPDLIQKAAELESATSDFWETKKQQELDDVDARMLKAYARAAMALATKNPAAARAVRRLGHYASAFGARMPPLLGRTYAGANYIAICAELDKLDKPAAH